jgi:hypothetical protein
MKLTQTCILLFFLQAIGIQAQTIDKMYLEIFSNDKSWHEII